jgi:DNA polymerase I-like protein with 3'-5' exonuclease and polymerase domains
MQVICPPTGSILVFQDTLCNTPVQVAAADIVKKALGLLPQNLANTGSQIIGTVYDKIILEVSEEVAEEAAVILKETMVQSGKVYLSKVPVEVEVTVADNWAEK